ncbi:MAG: response regulator [Pseudomonadota bacterium]
MMRVIFVDDEPNILNGLRRMLRPLRHEWDMSFAEGAQEALAIMADRPVDIVVSDMRMPDYDGAYLLTEVRTRYPETARIILSGHSEQELTIRSVSCAHQFLAKPCDADTLRETVLRTAQLRELMVNHELRRLTSEIGQLPSVPSVYAALTQEMGKEDPDLAAVASIVAADMAMSAKILQLVNSAFFGLRRSVSSIEHAVTYLGLDVIRSLVLSQSAFRVFEKDTGAESAEILTRRGQRIAAVAKLIAKDLTDNRVLVEEAFQAAMLHELGKLILSSELPAAYAKIDSGRDDGLSRADHEREALGVTHGEVGAYLLGLWGLSDGIIEAIAFASEPAKSNVRGFAPVVAVHIARALHDELYESPEVVLAADWVDGLDLSENLANWRALAQKQLDTRNAA